MTELQGSRRLTDHISCDVEVRWVNQGGFGLTFAGPDRLCDGRWYALKTMRPELVGTSPRIREMFVRAALVWIGLWPHANILTAHSVTEIGGRPFLVLDYAQDGSLRDLLALDQPLSTGLAWAQHIAAGLQVLHTPDPGLLRFEPLVHRDLKPDNVLISDHGIAMITDFDLTKVFLESSDLEALLAESMDTIPPDKASWSAAESTQSYRTARGVALGTPVYMAPEQWADAASAGPAADIYAFGLVLSELLAGRHALLDIEGRYGTERWRRAHEQSEPRPLCTGPAAEARRVPQSLQDLYAACLAKRPAERPTAAEVCRALARAATEVGLEPYNVPDVYPRTPEHEQAKWHNWSVAYLNFGYYTEALERNDRARALAPENWALLTTRGNILDALGRSDQALAAFDAAASIIPVDNLWGRKTILNNRGNCLSAAGRFSDADAIFVQAIALAVDADTWTNRALNERYWSVSDYQRGALAEARTHIGLALRYAEHALSLNRDAEDIPSLLAALRQFATIQLGN